MANILQGTDTSKYPGSFSAIVVPTVTLSTEMATLLGKSALATGEKPVTNNDLLTTGYPTVTQPFNQNDTTIATTTYVKSRNLITTGFVYADAGITATSSGSYVNARHDGFAEVYFDLTISVGTNYTAAASARVPIISSGLPNAVVNQWTLSIKELSGRTPFNTTGGAINNSIGIVTGTGGLDVYCASVARTVALRIIITGTYQYRT
jgi:hypothetical protein